MINHVWTPKTTGILPEKIFWKEQYVKKEKKEQCCSLKGGCSIIRKDNLPYILWPVKLRTEDAVDLLFVRHTWLLLSDIIISSICAKFWRSQKHSWKSTSQTAEIMFLLHKVPAGSCHTGNANKLSNSTLGNIKFIHFSLTYLKCLMEEFIDFLNYCSSTNSVFMVYWG